MNDSISFIESLNGKLSVSRRSFVKGAAALGGAAVLAGCSKDSSNEIVYGGGEFIH